MTDHDLEQRLRTWYRVEIDDRVSAPIQLRTESAALAAAAARSRRWLPAGWAFPRMSLGARLALAAAGLVVTFLVGASLLLPPSPDIGPSVSPSPTVDLTSPAPLPNITPEPPTPLVAFTHVRVLEKGVECPTYSSISCYEQRLWIVNPDGSGAHELLPGVGTGQALGWSPDGRWIMFGGPTLTNPTGSELRRLDVVGNDFAFSPDSTRLAFAQTDLVADPPSTAIAIFDIATGDISVIESSRRTGESGGVGRPRWSPDGTWIAFEQQVTGEPGERVANVLLVRPDGTDSRTLTVNALYAIDPDWSPDGSTLAFTSSAPVNGENEPFVSNIYTVGLDGADPVQVTTDGVSARPSWTRDGRIVYLRITKGEDPSGMELWVINADGSGAERLDAGDLAGLSAIGCVACIYPPTPAGGDFPIINEAFWQPLP